MASTRSPINGSDKEWDTEGSREWELPGEFLEGKRRLGRNGEEPFFFSDHELRKVTAAVRTNQARVLDSNGEEE